MKNTLTKTRGSGIGILKGLIVITVLGGTCMNQHAQRKFQSDEASITILEKQTRDRDSQLRVLELKKLPRVPKSLHDEAQAEDDSLRVLYDTNDPLYDPTEIWETDEYEGYYGNP